MSTEKINFALLEKSISTAQTNFPLIKRDTAKSIFGWVFKHKKMHKGVMKVAQKAVTHYEIPVDQTAGYLHVVAKYFNVEVDRRGKTVLDNG